jgi:hypothetical protein
MKITSANNRIEYNHHILYNDIEYVRKETLWVDKELKEENKLDFHIIRWSLFDDDGSPVEYYSGGVGWSGEDRHVRKTNPVPEIEKIFKETIGKNLIYF